MADDPVVLAIDQGTSSTKSVVLSVSGEVLSSSAVPLGASHPAPGHVEQDAAAMLAGARACLSAALDRHGAAIAAVGLSNQRESAVAWSRRTGEPLTPVLGWQDRRTVGRAAAMAEHAERVERISGLPLDPMFSALKLAHLLDEIDPDRSRSRSGEIALGTVDSYLVHALTGEHRIEVGNAGRTQLLDVATAAWSDELLDLFDIPAEALPRVAASDEPTASLDGHHGLRLSGVLGDSHAALFGHGVRAPGEVKVTYGSGSSVMGLEAPDADTGVPGLVRTIAWGVGGVVSRAYEGNILATGATLAWLSGVLGTTPAGLIEMARTSEPSAVDLVPAFSGLGAPWWDEQATAVLSGLELGTSRAALARAAAESIPLQVEDVLAAVDAAGGRIRTILADGGPSSNDWLVQTQADLSGRTVVRSDVAELSAAGVAHLAGLVEGVWSEGDLAALPRARTVFEPVLHESDAAARRARWAVAVARARLR